MYCLINGVKYPVWAFDVQTIPLTTIVGWIYTGAIAVEKSTVWSVLALATKWQIGPVKQLMEVYIAENVFPTIGRDLNSWFETLIYVYRAQTEPWLIKDLFTFAYQAIYQAEASENEMAGFLNVWFTSCLAHGLTLNGVEEDALLELLCQNVVKRPPLSINQPFLEEEFDDTERDLNTIKQRVLKKVSITYQEGHDELVPEISSSIEKLIAPIALRETGPPSFVESSFEEVEPTIVEQPSSQEIHPIETAQSIHETLHVPVIEKIQMHQKTFTPDILNQVASKLERIAQSMNAFNQGDESKPIMTSQTPIPFNIPTVPSYSRGIFDFIKTMIT